MRALVLVVLTLVACRRSPKPDVSPVRDEVDAAKADAPAKPATVRAVVAGGLASCVTYDDGAIRCWGWRMNGEHDASKRWLIPQPLVDVRDTVTAPLSLGGDDACASLDGRLACWGRNTFGGVGDGSETPRVSPVAVPDVRAVVGLSLGRFFTCAIVAGAPANRVLCWGDNGHGQIGCDDGLICHGPPKHPKGASVSPTEIPGAAGAIALSAGNEHVCAIVTGRRVVCWGSNGDGQIDASTVTGYVTEPKLVGLVGDARALASGAGHTCALLATGDVQCWGRDRSEGQLGQGAPSPGPGIKRLRSPPVLVPGLSGVKQLAAGLDHTCALLDSGKIACWGSNRYGQLGDGTRDDRPSPTEVVGVTTARAIAAGIGHACALLDDLTVKCWGWNIEGQLGDGTTTDRPVPTLVEPL